ncbi:hypothetical protein BDV41DRAFT_439503 [Aspergillus transmontanensis]|uniref:Glycine zipper 2TM domain-containing protein n=1 Tax=Aspergillus transmontanensis TaxID=1034304 RepID=A0A5N6VKZ4_9EURO|nr:hypothetical protein BDV41DRAFT_439503 [Aspergillus transmontanensis]
MSDQYGGHQYNQYGAPPHSNNQYGGYGGQPGSYPAQNQYGQPPQQGYYQSTPAYDQQPHTQHPSYGQQQNYPPPYSAGPQQGGYPGEYGHGQGSYMNPPQDGGHSPYPQQQYQQGESASYYGASTQSAYASHPGQAPGPAGQEGEKGLGSSILGATGGGFVGHKLGGGLLGTAGGALVGAVGANLANKAYVRHA